MVEWVKFLLTPVYPFNVFIIRFKTRTYTRLKFRWWVLIKNETLLKCLNETSRISFARESDFVLPNWVTRNYIVSERQVNWKHFWKSTLSLSQLIWWMKLHRLQFYTMYNTHAFLSLLLNKTTNNINNYIQCLLSETLSHAIRTNIYF